MVERNQEIFHPITLEDRDWINKKLAEENLNACEYTFANNFIWAEVYHVQVGEIGYCGVIQYQEEGEVRYSFPFGNGDRKAAVQELLDICSTQGYPLRLYPVCEKQRQELIEWFPGKFEIDSDRADSDYVYTVEKLSTLRGKKLHGKRNHIARFMDDGDWKYEAMTEKNIDECRKMAKKWIKMRSEKWNEQMEQEMGALEKAFAQFYELELVGGVLYKSDKMVAFSIGERLNKDTFVVHFEKAYPDLQGAYPMINQQFVLHEAQEFAFVNREEDTGDLGIRKAKLSYYPDMLIKKYHALESSVVFACEQDRESITQIWKSCFGDSNEYIALYLSNRFETENMLVIYEDKKPVSMASMLPVQVTIDGQKRAARYVYAVATLPAYRGKGYASKIINYASKKYKEPLLLQPAQESLERYYTKLGFTKTFQESPCWLYHNSKAQIGYGQDTRKEDCAKSELRKADIEDWQQKQMNGTTISNLNGWEVTKATPAEYKKIRDQYFEKEGYVEWDEQAVAYAMMENEFCHGLTLKLTQNERTAVVMYRVEGKCLKIVETTLSEKELGALLGELLIYTNTTKAYAQNAGGMIRLPEKEKLWEFEEGYLNLTLA